MWKVGYRKGSVVEIGGQLEVGSRNVGELGVVTCVGEGGAWGGKRRWWWAGDGCGAGDAATCIVNSFPPKQDACLYHDLLATVPVPQ